MKNKAFTLIELLVVIAIIGLLSSIVLVNLKGQRDKARIARGLQFSQSIHHALGAYAVGVWRFDEGSGITANDSSGYGNHGTLRNFTSPYGWTTDTPFNRGYSLRFDGVDDWVEPPSIRPKGAATISVWFKPEEWNSNRVYSILSSLSGAGSDPDDGIHRRGQLTVLSNGKVNAQMGSYSGGCYANFRSVTSAKTAPLGKWTHATVVMEFSPIFRLTLYLNGELAGISEDTVSCSNDFYYLWIGRRKLDRNMKGAIDEVRIYEKSLEISQIESLYYVGLDRLLAKGLISEQEYKQRL